MGVLLLELLVGSKGQILQFGNWPVTTSLRIILTTAFVIGWAISIIQNVLFGGGGRRSSWRGLLKHRTQYVALFALIVFAFVRGKFLGNTFVLADANAWADWVLLLPVLDITSRNKNEIRKLIPVFFVCIFGLAFKTLGLEYLFSHGFKSIAPDAYLWVRRTGVGEVTLVVGNAFRIFMQSYVYVVAAWIFSVAFLLTPPASSWEEEVLKDEKSKSPPLLKRGLREFCAWLLLASSTFILAMSLSRSFWIGTVAGLIALAILLSRAHIAWGKRLWSPISAGLVGLMLVGAVLAFPLPRVNMASLADLFGSRASAGEAAAASRWNLIPVLWHKILEHPILGSGFGATVTYQSKDPRIVAQTGTGTYTTYAFEWGWLEHWIKLGILGIPVMLCILISLGWRIWCLESREGKVESGQNIHSPLSTHYFLPLWFRSAAVSSLIALGVLHFFTPYLNHPLGFLYVLIGEAIIAASYAKNAENS